MKMFDELINRTIVIKRNLFISLIISLALLSLSTSLTTANQSKTNTKLNSNIRDSINLENSIMNSNSITIKNKELSLLNNSAQSTITNNNSLNKTKEKNTPFTIIETLQKLKFHINKITEANKVKDKNKSVFILNTEILPHKKLVNKEDHEQEVFPFKAESNTQYNWGVIWWNFVTYPPDNAIMGKSTKYWLSKDNVKTDFIEFFFEIPTKIDSLLIQWRLPPTSFKVEFRTKTYGPLIPVTDMVYKFEKIKPNGELGTMLDVSDENSLIFHKPIFVISVRVTMFDPLKSFKFSIFKVRFFNIRTNLMIINKSIDECKEYCLYINTNIALEGTNVTAVECLDGMSTADNRELFQFYGDRSIRDFNSKHCIGFDLSTKNVVLKDCGFTTTYRIMTNDDGSLSFNGYEDKCIGIDMSKFVSDNFVNVNTDLKTSSEMENDIYRKENLLIDSNTYWMTVPGVELVSLYINFGKINNFNVPGEEKWEIKKIDKILLKWEREPIKFRIFSWYPGSSWVLIHNEKHNNKGNQFPEFDNKTVYALRNIFIGSKSYKVVYDECKNLPYHTIIFDFEAQNYLNIEKTNIFIKESVKYSLSLESMISFFKKLQKIFKVFAKLKQTSVEIKTKLEDYEKNTIITSISTLKNFRSNILTKYSNVQYLDYYKKLESSVFTEVSSISDSNSNNDSNDLNSLINKPTLGASPSNPADSCIQIKKVLSNSLSGFYYIKNDCMEEAIKLWCDFSIYKESVDILVYSGNSNEQNPNLKEWNIEDYKSINFQCAKIGLKPINFKSQEIISRTIDLIKYLNYNLNIDHIIPIGFDYDCATKFGCLKQFKSFNDNNTQVLNYFFQNNFNNNNSNDKGNMAGIGFGHVDTLKIFDPKETKISAIVCSSNENEVSKTRDHLFVDCDKTLNGNGDAFKKGTERLIFCDSGCNLTNKKIYGSILYDGKSVICKAAIHFGAISSKGGKIKIKVVDINKDTVSYSSSNGLVSEKNPKIDGSMAFTFVKYVADCPIQEYLNEAKKENFVPYNYNFGSGNANKSSFLELTNKTSTLAKNKSKMNIEDINFTGGGYDQIKVINNNNNEDDGNIDFNFKETEANKNSPGIVHSNNINPNGYRESIGESTMSAKLNSKYDSIVHDNTITDGSSSVNLSSMNSNSEKLYEDAEILETSVSNSNTNKANNNSKVQITNQQQTSNNSNNSIISNNGNNSLSSNQANTCKNCNSKLSYIPVIEKECNHTNNSIQQTSINEINVINSINSLTELEKFISHNTYLEKNEKNILLKELVSLSKHVEAKTTLNKNENFTQVKNIISTFITSKMPHPEIVTLPVTPKPDPSINCLPTTESGMSHLQRIFEFNYSIKLESTKKQILKIKNQLRIMKKVLSWSDKGSLISNYNLFIYLNKIKYSFNKLVKELSITMKEANSRKIKSTKILTKWHNKLIFIKRFDYFEINYKLQIHEMFEIYNVRFITSQKAKWEYYHTNIKKRNQAIGFVGKVKPRKGIVGSSIIIKDKEVFDFMLDADILVSSDKGMCGLLFRWKSMFSYYALVFDLTKKSKYIVKVDKGKLTVLHQSNDGGIVINNWHKISIHAMTTTIKIEIENLEVKNNNNKQLFMIEDGTFSSGQVGFFTTETNSFYFDNIKLNSFPCWSPWTVKKSIRVITKTTNYYEENFTGQVENKYSVKDPVDFEKGPSIYKMFNEDHNIGTVSRAIYQKSMIFDKSIDKFSSMIIKNDIFFQNGVFKVSFIAEDSNGIISLIFKYNENVIYGETSNVQYYSFDFYNDKLNINNNFYILRKYKNKNFETLKMIKNLPEDANKQMRLGYTVGTKIDVTIACLEGAIKIFIGYNNHKKVMVVDYHDNSHIKYGLVGVGTYAVRTKFLIFKTYPYNFSVKNSEIKEYIKSSIKKPYTTRMNLSKVASSEQEDSSVRDISTEDISVTSNFSQTTIFDNTCISNNTLEKRSSFCSINFIFFENSYCEDNFCQICCEKSNPNDANQNHICQKSCIKALEETNQEKLAYYSECWDPKFYESSTLAYCDVSYNYSENEQNVCKKDFCMLCCNLKDIMYNKFHSFNSIEACEHTCIKKYDKEINKLNSSST